MVVSKFKSKISNNTYTIEKYTNIHRVKNLLHMFKSDYDTIKDPNHYIARLKFSVLTGNCYTLKLKNKIIGILAYRVNTAITEAVLVGYRHTDIIAFNVFMDYVLSRINTKELVIVEHTDNAYNSLLRYGKKVNNKIIIRLQDYNKEVIKFRNQLKDSILWEK